ncbi:MAG: hypothetical protein Q8P41_24520 [Pseudomonadota bacterium]|nr:hypothetical protein [Pseudomonadota bacterium]
MATVERSLFRFLGTLVTLAWAMHEMAHLHDLTRAAEPVPPGPPDVPGP